MRKTAYYCNHCGDLITGSIHKVFIPEVDDAEDLKNDQPLEKELKDIHLCETCTRVLLETIKSGMNKQKDDAAPAPKRGRPKKKESERKEKIEIAMRKYEQARQR